MPNGIPQPQRPAPFVPAPQQPEVQTEATTPVADPPRVDPWQQFLEEAFGEDFDADALADHEHGLPQPEQVRQNNPFLDPGGRVRTEIEAPSLAGVEQRLEARQNEFMERIEQVLEEVRATLPKRDEPYVTRNKPQAPPRDPRGRRKPVQCCYQADPPCPCHSKWLTAAIAFAATAGFWVAPLMLLAVLL